MAKRTNKSSVQNKKGVKSTPKSASESSGDSMKMTLHTSPTLAPRSQTKERRPGRPPSCYLKRCTGKAKPTARRSLDPCENSNDSGLGFDHHMETHSVNVNERLNWTDDRAQAKRPKLDNKLENDEVNDNYSFPEHNRTFRDNTTLIRTAPASSSIASLNVSNNQATTSVRAVPRCLPLSNRSAPNSPITLTTQLQQTSRYRDVSLSITCQPEQQHRARYQTEGSRGAVKDRTGNGFPIVQLEGYNKPATLQVFIGTDLGKVQPHMFYQACRVSGKNSTPCTEKRTDGTIVIELQLDPAKEMVATCDCVGILKERNVDVEHRFPDQLASRSKKKSTRCRMVFRTTITHDDGVQEMLQVCSQPIVCTQPPGIPEISKKSLTSCPASGGLELFVIGKNFLKDTSVYFQQSDDDRNVRWEQSVIPDKEYLQQTHLVCVVPPYLRPDITEPVTVRLYVVSSGKTSEAHQFVYTPVNGAMPSVHVVEQPQPAPFLSKMLWMTKQEQDVGMMPPPGTNMVPLSQRRTSTNMITRNEVHSPPMLTLKQEMMDENSQNSVMDSTELTQRRYRHISESSLDVHQGDSNISMINDNSIDMMRHNQMMHANMNDNSNMSLNDSSMDMMRSHSICENSLEHPNTSNMSMADDSCNSMQMTHRPTSVVDGNVFNQVGGILSNNILTPVSHTSMMEELKVMDLRLKMPMATVADLVHTNAPSMATLQSFGVTESSTLPLPAQSAQSIENYLTNIENKGVIKQVIQTNGVLNTNTQATLSHLGPLRTTYPPQRPLLTNNTQHQTDLLSNVSKSEAAAIGEQLPPSVVAIESGILPTPITTEKLDALVNCAAETHIHTQTQKEYLNKIQKNDILLSTRDVILNAPQIINSPLNSPIAPLNLNSNSPNLTSDVILNAQISPSLMCTPSLNQDALLQSNNMCSNNVEPLIQSSIITQSLLSNQSPERPLMTVTEPEKAIILNAAVDLYETQKQLNHLLPSENKTMNLLPQTDMQSIQMPGNTFIQYTTSNGNGNLENSLIASKSIIQDNKNGFIALPMKEINRQGDKKTEDRMIPPSFATMSENDLINIINPSCFDQV